MRIVWSSRAKAQVTEYGEYIAIDNRDAAGKWVAGILAEVERLKDFPDRGRVVPEAGRPDIREIFYQSHRVIYRIESKRMVVLTVRHSRQLMDLKEL